MANSTTVRFQLLPGALLLATLLLCAQAVIAQSQSQYDKGTPPQFAAGVSSLGSYASADLGTLNLSNGALNLSLPIGNVGGRGLSLPLTLNWSSKIWSASIDYDRERGPGGLDDPNASMVPLAYADYANSDRLVSYYSRIEAGWTIGGVPTLNQTVVRINYTNVQPQGPCYGYTLPKLTLMMPDRGEVEFRDDVYDGAPLPSDCSGWIAASRGQRWHAVDGSGLVYINATNNGAAGQIPDLSGVVITGEGTRFFFDSGGVCYLITDRHGNKITISGNEFVDPLGRTTTIQQDVSDPENPSETLAVLVTFKGYDNQPRYYKVRSGIMNQHYRSDINPNLPVITGSYDPMSWGYDSWYPASATKLFPFSYGLFVQQIDTLPVISELMLPDHRSMHFNYNQFGEVAEVQMPTGGKVWYDYGYDGGLPSGKSPIFETSAQYHTSVPFVDRALLKRRTFPDGTTLEGTLNYSYLGSSTTVTASAPDETVMLNEAHFFLPAGRYTESFAPGHHGTFYNLWSTGIEYRTEIRNASGAILVASEQDWTQRAPVSWSTGYAQEQPAKDNRVNEARKILDDGSMTKVHTNYQPNVNYNNPVEVQEFDFDQSLKRLTTTTYADSSNWINGGDYTSDSIRLLHLPLVMTVYDGNGNQKARTVNEYDNYANDLNHAPLQDYGTVTQHDINYGPSYTTRGNLTRAGRWLNLTSSFIYSYPRYDDLGNVVAAKDANGSVSTISFIDDFGNGSNPGAGASGSFGATYAFPTLITSPPPTPGALVQTARSQYDFSTGLLTGFKDRNGVVTQSIYNDPFNRPTQVKAALGVTGQETHSKMYYAPATLTSFGLTLTNNDVLMVSDQTTIDDATLRSWTRTDGFGRTTEAWSRDPQGDDKVVTLYDALGRANQQSNPFRPSLGESALYTTTEFDLAGRVRSVTTPDGAVVSTDYSGRTVTVTDQALKQRKSLTDGLGRLTAVYEAPNDVNSNYLTGYAYDTLDNLIGVSQIDPITGYNQTRSFAYDSLKRLTSASNPESGTITYLYDNNGNLTRKTDARGIYIDYVYDALNRNKTVDYSNTSLNPDISRSYDASVNGTGRLSSAGASSGYGGTNTTDSYVVDSYDALGRPKVQRQLFHTNGVQQASYEVQRSYDLAGHVSSQTYPSNNRTVNYSYDLAGRTSSFSGQLGGVQRTYSNEMMYAPAGQMEQEQFGTDTPVYKKLRYNSRQQLSELRASTTPNDLSSNRGEIINWYSGQCGGAGCNDSDNNGNLRRQGVSVPNEQNTIPTSWYQQYEYDNLNRLKQVHEHANNAQLWQQSYGYDRYGNRTITSASPGINAKQFDVQPATNRLYAQGDLNIVDASQRQMRYDLAGNLTNDSWTSYGSSTPGAVTRTYDAENRMTSALDSGGGTTHYTYNSDGQRVRRSISNQTEVWQVYGMDGELLAEYAANAPSAPPQKEYGYCNGQLLVEVTATMAGWGAPPAYTPPNPLVSGWEIKLEHLTELRSAVNQLRDHAGLPAFNFTVDPNPVRNVTTIKADHIRQLRQALEGARSQLGLSIGGYAHSTLTENSSWIYAIDFQELRNQIQSAWNSGTGGVDIRWLVADQLGTPRIIIDKTGALANVKRHDYLPFGEELVAGQGLRTSGANGLGYDADNVRQKFTSKERDIETGLDYFLARYYSSTQGRFTSPDEFTGGPEELFDFAEAASANPTYYADLGNPQSLNKYQYTYNNPLRYTDPDGHCPDGQPCPGLIVPTPTLTNGVIGGAKAIANIGIGMNNVSAHFGIPGTKHIEPYKPDNLAQLVGMVITEDVSIFGALLGGRPQVGGVLIAETKQTALVASAAGNASRAKSAAQMAEELTAQTGKTSVPYTTPNKSGHIDLKDVRNPLGHFDKATGMRIPAPTVQERSINVGGNAQVNLGKQTTKPATKQDIRTARKLIDRQ